MCSNTPPTFVARNSKYGVPDWYVPLIIFLTPRLSYGRCFGVVKSTYRGSFFAISSGMFKLLIMRDKANQGLSRNPPLLLSRIPFSPRAFFTELIECTCATTLELSLRILGYISISPPRNKNPDNIRLRKRAAAAAVLDVVFLFGDVLLGILLGWPG